MSFKKFLAALAMILTSAAVFAHGDVTPQAVDTSTLPPLGDEMLDMNPYKGNKEAVRIGSSAYNQNCARCHGLEAISGGISPDLRKLNDLCSFYADKEQRATCEKDEVDTYFRNTVLGGRVRNGNVYMPPFAGILQQEAIWAIKSYIETRPFEE